MAEPIQLQIEDGIATLTMDDGRANAINETFLLSMERALKEAASAGALIIRGREKVFCGGLDLPALVALDRSRADYFFNLFDSVHLQLLEFPRHIVTCCRGSAIAGGAILLAAGDARLALDGGKVGITEAALGLSFPTPALEIVRVALGDRNLGEAATTGRLYEGTDRQRIGFVTEVVSADAMDQRAGEIAGEYARLDGRAVGYVRLQVRRAAIERAKAFAVADRAVFLDGWYSEATQTAMKAVVARLKSR